MGLLLVIKPKGLYTYRHGQFLIKDIMEFWGTSEGLTTKQVIQAIKAHSNDNGGNRFTLCTQQHHTIPAEGNIADWASRAIDPDHKDVQSRAMWYTTTEAEGQRECFTRPK